MRSSLICSKVLVGIACGQIAFGQTKAIREFTPTERTVLDSYGRQIIVAQGLLREGKASAALAQATAAIAKLESLKPMDIPGDYYVVAQCHLALGHPGLALAEFKKCFVWDKQKGDLFPRVGDWMGCAADYAITLSQAGRTDEAKAIYYYGLRNLNAYGDRGFEPYPFVVVFDSSAEGDVWNYSTQRFEAACLMMKAIAAGGGDDWSRWIARAASLAPGWLYPHLYRGFHHASRNPREDFDRAHQLAVSQQDHNLIDRVAALNRDHMPTSMPNPAEVRYRMMLLQTSKASLAKSRSSLTLR